MRTAVFASLTGLIVASIVTMSTPAAAQTLVTKTSPHDVAATVARIETAVQKRGATVVARVDHAAAAKANGLELGPTVVVIFGNPKLGTPLMQANPSAGLDLPMRVVVWQDKSGAVKVGYWPPALLAEMHAIKDRAAILQAMTGALGAITDEAIAR